MKNEGDRSKKQKLVVAVLVHHMDSSNPPSNGSSTSLLVYNLLITTYTFSAIPRVTKLATLLVKTLAKPLSKRIKHEFSRYKITQRMLIGIGQANHQLTSRMTIWSAGYTVRRITPLEEEKALSTGAEFVGEAFILLVSGGTIVWEYNRSREKDRVKELKRQAQTAEERQALRAKLHALNVRVKALEEVVEKNSQSMLSIGQEKYVRPDSADLVEIDDHEQEERDRRAIKKAALQLEAVESKKATEKQWWGWKPW